MKSTRVSTWLRLPGGGAALAIAVLLAAAPASADRQSFLCTNCPITIPPVGAMSPHGLVTVSASCTHVVDLNVTIDIGHGFPQDLDVFLRSPAGTMVELFTDDCNGTVFDDEVKFGDSAGRTFGATGGCEMRKAYQPVGELAALRGENPAGVWELRVTDDFSPDGGTLVEWSLIVDCPTLLRDNTSGPSGTQIASQDWPTADDELDSEAADDFAIAVDTAVQVVEVIGVQSGATTATSDVRFYSDGADTRPDVLLCNRLAVPVRDPGANADHHLALDEPCFFAAPGGSAFHWLSVQANSSSASNVWSWNRRTTQHGLDADWRNPLDGFGTGCTAWSDLPTCVATPGPDLLFRLRGSTNLYFADGFERQVVGFANWSAVQNPDDDLIHSLSPVTDGSLSLAVDVDDTVPVYLLDQRPAAGDDFHARFLLYADLFTVGTDGERTKIFQARSGTNRRSITLVLRQQGGVNRVLAKSKLDDESFANTGFFDLSPGWHLLEVSLHPAAVNGYFDFFIDGEIVFLSPPLDNDLSQVEDARLGVISVKPGATGSFYLDSYEARSDAIIGP